ncbi:MAG: NADH-quinone oxidoreductase subunit J family protein [Candidatus Adiutrix sp.]
MDSLITSANLALASTASLDALLQSLSDQTLSDAGQQIMAFVAFGLYLTLIVAGGLVSVLARSLVRALFGLVVTFLGVAGMYLLLASPFMAFMQLLIYIGAICVLIFFAIMMVRNTSSGEEVHLPTLSMALYGLLAAVAPIVLLGPIILLNAASLSTVSVPVETPLVELGQGLLENYVVPFELISIILMVAMTGGVFLAWEKRSKK